jgi:choline dehydrogenase
MRFNYLGRPDDWTEMRAAVRLTCEVFAQPAFDRYRGREIQPGDAVRTDAEIDAFVQRKVESAYHPYGTCRMGRADDPQSVVDLACRVIGVEGLRMIDSSIMPTITTGNLNAPTIMIGEKGADHARACPAAGRKCAHLRGSEPANRAAVTVLICNGIS